MAELSLQVNGDTPNLLLMSDIVAKLSHDSSEQIKARQKRRESGDGAVSDSVEAKRARLEIIVSNLMMDSSSTSNELAVKKIRISSEELHPEYLKNQIFGA